MNCHFDAATNRMIQPQEIGAILKDAFVRNMSNESIADLHGTTRKAVYDIIWKHRNISAIFDMRTWDWCSFCGERVDHIVRSIAPPDKITIECNECGEQHIATTPYMPND